MYISMIGIDHSMAPVDVRAKYAFTRKNAGEAMEQIRAFRGIAGCILLSTCNRLELWASVEEDAEVSLYDILCEVKGVADREDFPYFVKREGRPAVEHLFDLSAGLKSQIFGEDQILTQVKDALTMSREHFASDGILEVLFRMAITSAKKIKTEVPLTHGNSSVIHRALALLKEQGTKVEGMTCMVIGNGEMGKTAASALKEAGADVTVTVRQYRSGVVEIPKGCKRINYGERMEYLPSCDLVVSATASPNFTLRQELFEPVTLTRPLILMDLAVPRDVEPSIGNRKGITLYDMDSFKSERSHEQMEQLHEAHQIVAAQVDEFIKWFEGRDIMPRIEKIKEAAAHDLMVRLDRPVGKLLKDEQLQREVETSVETSAVKMVNKLIFGLRDEVSPEAFLACVTALEKLYEN